MILLVCRRVGPLMPCGFCWVNPCCPAGLFMAGHFMAGHFMAGHFMAGLYMAGLYMAGLYMAGAAWPGTSQQGYFWPGLFLGRLSPNRFIRWAPCRPSMVPGPPARRVPSVPQVWFIPRRTATLSAELQNVFRQPSNGCRWVTVTRQHCAQREVAASVARKASCRSPDDPSSVR